MSKFAELRDQYNAKKIAVKKDWEDLFSQVARVATKFSAYLDIPESSSVIVDRITCPLIVIGMEQNGVFKIPRSRDEFNRQDDALLLDLMLVLAVSEQGEPEKSVIYNLSIEKAGNFYILRDRRTGDSFKISNDDCSAVLEHLYLIARQNI